MNKYRNYLLCSSILFLLAASVLSCKKDPQARPQNTSLQHKWTILKRTGTFAGNAALNFEEQGDPADFLDFRANDSVYSYYTLYLPFSIDTASYTVNGNIITTHDTRQYGIIFQHQDNNGVMQATTDIEILSMTESTLRLKFPTQGTVTVNGVTTYYPGSIVYDLKR
jgi:hypothetical protein